MNTPWLRRSAVVLMTGLCLLGMAACSNSKKDQTYEHSQALPPLEVPPDLVNPPKDASTAIPTLPPAAPRPVSAAPAKTDSVPAATVAVESGAVHVERQGAQRWLVAVGAVAQVQQRVKDFLLQEGFSLAREANGSLETEWRGGNGAASKGDELDAALNAGLQDKYKLRIEAGRVADTSEVTVSHFGLQRVMVDNKAQWQPRVTDPMLEAELLDKLRTFLASEGAAPASEPVSDLPAVKVRLTTDEQGGATLSLNEAFDRAWRRVGIALGRGRFVIEDRNRSEGIYNIRLGTAFEEDKKAGFVARLFGSNAGDSDEKYRIVVKDRGDETVVVVQFPGGGPVFTRTGERILDRLKEKMQ